jgi:hypothetical protein
MATEAVPYARLGISQDLGARLDPGAPRAQRLSAARGELGVAPEVQLSVCYVLASDLDTEIRDAARATIVAMPVPVLTGALHPQTHSKVLELVAALRAADQEVGARLYANLNGNDRTAILVAERAGPDLCERIVDNKPRLLISPSVLTALHRNPNCPDALLDRAASFLRMENEAPELPASRPWEIQATPASPSGTGDTLVMFDLPDTQDRGPLAGFSFDFQDEMSAFANEFVEEKAEDFTTDRERQDMEKALRALPVGQRVRLAYLGNRQVRQILIRDNNKMVAVAVIRSGRCGDAEITMITSNRNIHDDVLREVAQNREWMRKYPVRVALVNNPKTPVGTAVALVGSLQVQDLAELARNHNVSSVVTVMAQRLHQQKVQARVDGKSRR